MNSLNTPPGAPPMLVGRLEAARLLGISPGTIDNMKNRGELASVKLNARRLYHVDDLKALIEARKEVAR